MSQQVPASFQTKYQNNLEMVLQQHKSVLLDAVTVTDDASASKIKVKDLVGTAKPAEADERHGDTKYANTPHDGIWLPKKPELYYAEIVDNSDKLETGIDLEGSYVMEGAAVVERSRDRRILEGIYGDVISGREGIVVTPFPSGQIVPVTVGGASGAQRMNVAKLRAANKLLAKGHVDVTERKYMVLTAEQSDDLLSEVPATSQDFKASFGGEVDENGFVRRLLGWNFIHMELDNDALGSIPGLSLDGSGYRKNPFWVKSGVRANFWQRLRSSLDPLPTKVLSRQVFAGTTLAATRTQAAKVGVILNSEA